MHVVVAIYFLQDSNYIHSFSSVLALSFKLKSGAEMCIHSHDRVNTITLHVYTQFNS